MVNPECWSLSGLVQIDETSIPHRTKDDPIAVGQGRSHDGKLLIAMSSAPRQPTWSGHGWVHRVFANLKCWALGVYHGLRAKHLQAYLDEFVFRFNRRRKRPAAFNEGIPIETIKENLAAEVTQALN